MSRAGLHDASREEAAPLRTPAEAQSYLNDGNSLRSWLLTTDHKRIAILYLISITGFFAIAATAAAMMRLNLLTPQGALLTALPDRLSGHRLAGRAQDNARAREALNELGLNPLMVEAFRDRSGLT